MVLLILFISIVCFVLAGILLAFATGFTPFTLRVSQGEPPLIPAARRIFMGMDNPVRMAIPKYFGHKPM